jgi:hypothetical protein
MRWIGALLLLPLALAAQAKPDDSCAISGQVSNAATGEPVRQKDRREREAFYQTATSDLSGQFTFKSVTPGEYRVYAWEDVEYSAWMDPEFVKPLETRGEAVSVSEGGRQAIQVNLISADAQ